jgi:hypothetical protein
MRIWRLCREPYAAEAFSGEGARRFGGRWNSRGVPMVYASTSLALAAIELFVHLEPGQAPGLSLRSAARGRARPHHRSVRVAAGMVDGRRCGWSRYDPRFWRCVDASPLFVGLDGSVGADPRGVERPGQPSAPRHRRVEDRPCSAICLRRPHVPIMALPEETFIR